jgi:hypothetical protein
LKILYAELLSKTFSESNFEVTWNFSKSSLLLKLKNTKKYKENFKNCKIFHQKLQGWDSKTFLGHLQTGEKKRVAIPPYEVFPFKRYCSSIKSEFTIYIKVLVIIFVI